MNTPSCPGINCQHSQCIREQKIAVLIKAASDAAVELDWAKNVRRESVAGDVGRVIQIGLGHTSRRSGEIYGRLDREEYEAAMNEVDGKVNGKPRLRLADLRKMHEGRVS